MATSQELQALLQEFCGATGRKQRNLEAKLAVLIPKLNGIARVNNHIYFDDYNELLNDVISEVLQTVCTEFDPNQSSLVTWINEIKRLKYRVKELYPNPENDESHSHALGEKSPEAQPSNANRDYKKLVRRSLKYPDSLNRIIGKGDDSDHNSSFEDFLASPTLSGLEKFLEADQNALDATNIHPIQKLITYLETDPDQILRSRVPKDNDRNLCPACNDHEVVKFLYLDALKAGQSLSEAEQRGKIKTFAQQHNVNYNTLYSRIKNPDRPGTIQNFVLGFGIELGLISEQLKAVIEADLDGELSACTIRNYPECNCLFLAKRRLPLFVDPPLTFNKIADEINHTCNYNLTDRKIQKHWQTSCYPRLGKLAATLGYNTFSNAGVES